MNKRKFNKIFRCGRTELSRADLENLPVPFYTNDVSDDDMQNIVEEIEEEMQDWYSWEEDGSITSDKVSEHWWKVLEETVVAHGVPYYEDMELEDEVIL